MKKSRQVVGLDALRFAAAVLVVAYHLTFWGWTPGPAYAGPFPSFYRPFTPLTQYGWIGVEFFFVLSGFVIAYSAEGNTARRFLEHRWLRLFPGTLICATLTTMIYLIVTVPFTHKQIFLTWMRSAFILPRGPYVDDSYWTLTVEVSFYTVIFLLLLARRGRWVERVMSIIGAVSSLFWIVAFLPSLWPVLHYPGRMITEDAWPDFLNLSLLGYGCYFAIGVLLWLCLLKRATPKRIAVLLFCGLGGLLQIVHHSHWVSLHTIHPFSPVGGIVLWLLMTGLVIVSVLMNESMVAAIGDRGMRVFRRLGLMTFPLYLLHQTLGLHTMPVLRRHLPEAVVFTGMMTALLALAYSVSAYMEPWVQQRLRNGLARLRGSSLASSASQS